MRTTGGGTLAGQSQAAPFPSRGHGGQPVATGEICFRSALRGSRKSLSRPFLKVPSGSFNVISGGHPSLASSTLSTTPTAREIRCVDTTVRTQGKQVS